MDARVPQRRIPRHFAYGDGKAAIRAAGMQTMSKRWRSAAAPLPAPSSGLEPDCLFADGLEA